MPDQQEITRRVLAALGADESALAKHFVEVGGDSLTALQLATEVGQLGGSEVDPELFFDSENVGVAISRLCGHGR